jgi:hypothetical protein
MEDIFVPMGNNNSVLLYNLYPLNNWRQITNSLLSKVPHDDIYVHINIPKRNPIKAYIAYYYLLNNKKVKEIFFSINLKSKGESTGFKVFRKNINFDNYKIATYVHSKGSSRKRKNTKPIKAWVELLRYYTIERLDLAKNAFQKGYLLFGVNLQNEHIKDKSDNIMFPETKFHYSGNFVTINLNYLRYEFLNNVCLSNYYGVEVFWGTLCSIEKAYCVHQSNVNHYEETYSESYYKDLN